MRGRLPRTTQPCGEGRKPQCRGITRGSDRAADACGPIPRHTAPRTAGQTQPGPCSQLPPAATGTDGHPEHLHSQAHAVTPMQSYQTHTQARPASCSSGWKGTLEAAVSVLLPPDRCVSPAQTEAPFNEPGFSIRAFNNSGGFMCLHTHTRHVCTIPYLVLGMNTPTYADAATSPHKHPTCTRVRTQSCTTTHTHKHT